MTLEDFNYTLADIIISMLTYIYIFASWVAITIAPFNWYIDLCYWILQWAYYIWLIRVADSLRLFGPIWPRGILLWDSLAKHVW